ncbi:hypothetical protein GUJ93_ZPchr0013g34819 [Zizania palustris]|uniref:PUM-HD domain-containing protein n=1 Tax=Zizania palustris TaxID=103762 RepID=A0A8J5WU99_ZIZPA|nr:hypothetical protein GUJ93_ZPchr0013g34819 [Zizania palustris]
MPRRGAHVPAVNSMSQLAHGSTAPHGSYYNFGAPGFSVHHEPVFADQAGNVARSQCFAGDVGLDGYDCFPTRFDTSVGPSCTLLGPGMAPPLVDDNGLRTTVMPGGQSCFLGSLARNTAEGYTTTASFPNSSYGPLLNHGNEISQQCVANMARIKRKIYLMAKHKIGCRFLQQKFEQGKRYVDAIFEGIVDRIAELMTNSFANGLVHKLLDVCDEEQRTRIIAVLAEDPVNCSGEID